jgi:hypothetical protein
LRVEHERAFDVPLAPAFAYITELENGPTARPGIVRVEPGSRWAAPGGETRIV